MAEGQPGAERRSALGLASKLLKNQEPRPLISLCRIWFSLRFGLDFVASDLAFVALDLDFIAQFQRRWTATVSRTLAAILR